MKEFSVIFLLAAAIHHHGVQAFVVSPPPSRLTVSSTELCLFRKEGKLRSKFRRFRGIVRRKVLRQEKILEVEMRDDTESRVVDGIPESRPPLIEEDIVIIEDPETNRLLAEEVIEWGDLKGEEEYDTRDGTLEEGPFYFDDNLDSAKDEFQNSEEEMEALAALEEAKDALDALENIETPLIEDGPILEEEPFNLFEDEDMFASPNIEEEQISPLGSDDEEQSTSETTHEPVLNAFSEEEKLIKDVDSFFAAGNPELALGMLEDTNTNSSGPLYWRLVKTHYELFVTTDDKAQQQDYLEKGLNLIEATPKQLNKDLHTRALLLKWKGILLGKLGSFQSTKQKMSNSFVIKESLETARQLLEVVGEEDGSVYQALGEWCFKVAGISFLERQAASMLFGKPPNSSYEESVHFFLKAYELKGTPALATKVSEAYQKMGEEQLALHWANKAIPTSTETLRP